MTLQPKGKVVIIRKKEENAGGLIFIPEKYREKPPMEGTIVAYGSDCTDFIKSGEKVVFGQYSAFAIPDGKNLFYIMEDDIWYKKTGEEMTNG